MSKFACHVHCGTSIIMHRIIKNVYSSTNILIYIYIYIGRIGRKDIGGRI